MVIAVVTAGGIGSRVGANIPKQFIEIKGKPIIVYTLEKLQYHSMIDKIYIACLKGYEEKLIEYKEKYDLNKIEKIVLGGETGPKSISNCIDQIQEDRIASNEDIILVHAGTRPLVSEELISKGIELCQKKGNAVPYINCPEVIVDRETGKIIERTKIARLQTPQIFKYKDIVEMYQVAKSINFENVFTTADLFLNQGRKVELYEGSDLNFKITYKEDLKIFEGLV